MMLRLAVERLLEIISEASRHIPVDARNPISTGDGWPILAIGFDMLTTGPIQVSCGT
jgi:hypothetical protein